VKNGAWEEDIKARRIAEGRHRGLLLQIARVQLQFDWMFCFDADERVTGDLRGFLGGPGAGDCDGVRIRLFDAYMTPDDHAPYQPNRELFGLSSIFWPGTKGHSDALAEPPGGVPPENAVRTAWQYERELAHSRSRCLP
jgi:hypothetical protein